MSVAAIAPLSTGAAHDGTRPSFPALGTDNIDLPTTAHLATQWPSSPSDDASPAHQRLGLLGTPSGGSAPSLSDGSHHWLREALRQLPAPDQKSLNASAHKKSRKVLRCLSYPALPAAGTERERRERTAKNALARAQRVPEKEKPSKITLDQALGQGSDCDALRLLVADSARALAMDGASEACANGGCLDWVHDKLLTRSLDAEPHEGPNFGASSQSFRRSTQADTDSFGDSMEGSPRSAAAGISFGGIDGNWTNEKLHKAFERKHWPSIATFEKYYQPPLEAYPPPAAQRPHEVKELPAGRRSISCIEEAVGFGAQAYLWPILASNQTAAIEHPHATMRPRSGKKSAGIFEAAAVYKAACKELSVERFQPVPIFGERTEIHRGNTEASTRQCYALAEAIKACSPQELVFGQGLLTDMGCAKLIEAAMSSGRLKHLEIDANALSYKTCTALYSCLRTRSGACLTSLCIAECGLGGDLEEPLEVLGANVMTAYNRSKVALLGSPNDSNEFMQNSDDASKEPEDDASQDEKDHASTVSDPVELEIPKQAICTCPHGTAATGEKCDKVGHGNEACRTCDDDYIMDNGICVQDESWQVDCSEVVLSSRTTDCFIQIGELDQTPDVQTIEQSSAVTDTTSWSECAGKQGSLELCVSATVEGSVAAATVTGGTDACTGVEVNEEICSGGENAKERSVTYSLELQGHRLSKVYPCAKGIAYNIDGKNFVKPRASYVTCSRPASFSAYYGCPGTECPKSGSNHGGDGSSSVPGPGSESLGLEDVSLGASIVPTMINLIMVSGLTIFAAA